MIDLTPLDVRKKRGDFRRGLRGYDPEEVDHFLELVSERLEEVVRENRDLKEKASHLSRQVEGQEGREKAVHEALVTAQELREEIQGQARKEADLIRREAEGDAQELRRVAEDDVRRIQEEGARILEQQHRELEELNRARDRFLRGFRRLLEEQLDFLEVEEAREDPSRSFPKPPDTSEAGGAGGPEIEGHAEEKERVSGPASDSKNEGEE
jgi:cell division initiation protein